MQSTPEIAGNKHSSDARLWWLHAVCLSVMVILLVGGITRLTGSGLSMVDWRPVSGILPPIGDAGWAEEFARYQESPQYKLVNQGMSLSEFKYIFFLGVFTSYTRPNRRSGLSGSLPMVSG